MVGSRIYTVNEVIEALDWLDGQIIRVWGGLRVEFEGDALWHLPVSEHKPDHGSHLWAEFALAALGMSLEQLNEFHRRQVVAAAIVCRELTGHMGLSPGGLLIRRLEKRRREHA